MKKPVKLQINQKACDKTPVLKDLSVVNTTTSAQVVHQNNADNSKTSTGQNQKRRKDTEEGAMEKILIIILTKSQPTNFEFPKTKIYKKKTGRLIDTGKRYRVLFQLPVCRKLRAPYSVPLKRYCFYFKEIQKLEKVW